MMMSRMFHKAISLVHYHLDSKGHLLILMKRTLELRINRVRPVIRKIKANSSKIRLPRKVYKRILARISYLTENRINPQSLLRMLLKKETWFKDYLIPNSLIFKTNTRTRFKSLAATPMTLTLNSNRERTSR